MFNLIKKLKEVKTLILKSYSINEIIEKNNLTLAVSTIVKLITCFDKLILKCYYKGVPEFVESNECKFCKQYQNKLKSDDVKCRKHYAIDLYNNPETKISEIFYRENRFQLFGRYVVRKTENCTFIFYLTPIQIDLERHVVYAIPNNILNDRRSIYTWTEFKRPGVMNFDIDMKNYRLDFSNKYHPTVVEI